MLVEKTFGLRMLSFKNRFELFISGLVDFFREHNFIISFCLVTAHKHFLFVNTCWQQ